MTLLDFIFPKRCVGCRKIGRYFCDQCRLHIQYIAPCEGICPVCERAAIGGATHPKCRTRYCLDGLTSFFHYGGLIQRAVKTIKYRFVFDLATEFVSLAPSVSFPGYASLVPIPLHLGRARFRGFNQAEVLGRVLAKRLHIPLRPDILRRTRETMPQAELKDKAKRLANMRQAFGVSGRLRMPSVILFDDVFTTGATMRSAAYALKRAGVKRVWAVTMAR